MQKSKVAFLKFLKSFQQKNVDFREGWGFLSCTNNGLYIKKHNIPPQLTFFCENVLI